MAAFDQFRDDRAAEHERCLRRLGVEMKPESAGVSYEVAAKPTALPLIARQGPFEADIASVEGNLLLCIHQNRDGWRATTVAEKDMPVIVRALV
jgi:hypothetical protein